MSLRPLRSAASLIATLALVAAGIAATTSAAQAAPVPGSVPCPDAFNPNLLTPGRPVTGLTTTIGTTPEQFHGTYQRTIADGIAPGMDLLVFKMSGSRITDGDTIDAGIWAGMSGSPVYDDATGELIGAVSYGFSNSPSDIAGVTPASYMYDLSNPKYNPTSVTAHSGAKVSSSVLSSLQKKSDGNAPLGQPKMLRPKKQISGGADADQANAQAARSKMLQKGASYKKSGFLDVVGQTSTPQNDPIVVGGNLATTFSYGEVTTASVGTVTAICDGKVIGYGHPDEFSGKSNETFHGASVVAVQPDVLGSYKLANIGTVKGVINQDRMQGILGTLDQIPVTSEVHSVTHGLGDTKTSTTKVSVPFALSYVVATQAASDAQSVLNQYSSGDADMSWTITYTRSGEPGTQTFQHSQRYSVSQDFPDEVSYDAASDVEELASNPFEKVTISKVDITSNLLPDYNAVKPTSAQYLKGGVWKSVPSTGIKATPGSSIPVRIHLAPADNDTTVHATTLDTTVHTSTSSHGSASIQLIGQGQYYDGGDDEEFFAECDECCDDEECTDDPGPQSLDELIDLLASEPRQDDIVRVLSFKTKTTKKQAVKIVRSPYVTQGSLKIKLVFPK
ncbi:MAG: hypothetical protein QOJ72_1264 [Nocardioidaceae bacterium]|nr:hypothetical protein [Nocardioidaceae bacterium]